VRLEQALAYRAKVDDAYEQGEVRPNIAEKYPDEFRITDYKPSHGDGPHRSREGWTEDINFDENRKGRRHNCGECARAVQSSAIIGCGWSPPRIGGHWFNAG
jgi:hypothetical protein